MMMTEFQYQNMRIVDSKAKSVAGNVRTIVRLWNSPIFKEFGGRKLALKEIGLTKTFFEANALIDKILEAAAHNPMLDEKLEDLRDEVHEWRDSIFSERKETRKEETKKISQEQLERI